MDCFLCSQNNFYFPRWFSCFSSYSSQQLLLFSTFSVCFIPFQISLLLQFFSFCIYWGYLRMSVVLSYSAALQVCQLYFSRMLWVPRLAVPRLAGISFRQYFSKHHLLSVFFPLYQGCLYGWSHCFLALVPAFLPVAGPISLSGRVNQNMCIRKVFYRAAFLAFILELWMHLCKSSHTCFVLIIPLSISI